MNDLFPESVKIAIASGQVLSYDTKEMYKVERADKWNVEVWTAGYEYPHLYRFDTESEAKECLAVMNGRDISK